MPPSYDARGRQKYRAGRRPTEPVGGKKVAAALWDVFKKNRSPENRAAFFYAWFFKT